MNNYRLTIQYDGSRYKGWQRLGNEENTIQGKLEDVITRMTGEETELIGCSRTDAGVHALAQVANFKTVNDISEAEIMSYLNHYLPNDISIIDVTRVSPDFHARYLSKDKTYLYRIWNLSYPNPFMRKYSMHVEQYLNIEEMEKGAAFFLGEHDFTAFSNAKSKKKSMVREIYSIDITKNDAFVFIRVRGNAFLYNMVRRMVGTLIEIGLGKKKAEDIPDILNSKERNQTGTMAEACGLYLENINYKSET